MPKKTTIVLADEQTLFREGLVAICESTPHYRVVGQCGDGKGAIKLIGALLPDLAILDLELPKLHALAVIQKVRQTGPLPKFLVVTSRSDRKTVLEVLRGGANGYVLKTDPSACLLRGARDVLAGSIYVSPQLKLAEVFRGSAAAPVRESYEGLSPREYQVFMLLMQGLRGKEIANRLDLSPKTISTYRVKLMRKLGIYDVPGLVRYAVRQKLIPLR